MVDGRAAVGEILRAAQKDLQKVALVFLFGLLGTIMFLYYFGWDRLKADLLSSAPQANVITRTPFEVILLQAKIGLVVGGLLALPVIVYFGRDALKRRGVWPEKKIPTWQLVGMGLVAAVLFALGILYGYYVFFPVMFEFLASNAAQAGFSPDYGITEWIQFVLFLTFSFGLAAQLPLAMAALAYAEIVRYETFRDKWRYAVVAIFAFGAVFSPPDPFTQVMWAVPLLFLYGLSLGFTKFVVTVHRGSAEVDFRAEMRDMAPRLMVMAVASFVATYATIAYGAGVYFNDVVQPAIPTVVRPPELPTVESLWGIPRAEAIVATSVVVAFLLTMALMVYYVYLCLEAASEMAAAGRGPYGDPSAIDMRALDAAGVRAAPPEAFAEMDEEEALDVAGTAMDDGDHEKAQAVLDRFDEAEAGREAKAETEAADADAGDGADADDSGVVTRTSAGMLGAFTDDETDEEDIGGYLYDVQFILGSLASKSFRLIAVFMVVMGLSFAWLYSGGIGDLQRVFLSRLPTAGSIDVPLVAPDPITGGAGSLSPNYVVRLSESVSPEAFEIVALHPVEALVFQVKLSLIFGAAAVLPLLLYYVWPALKDRGFVSGNRGVLFTWAVTTAVSIVLGSIFGFLVVAPTVISWLAADIVGNGMLIKYQISSYGWLVFFTTLGIGLLTAIPTTMLLFHRGGIVPFRIQRDRWREAVTAVFALSAFFTPRGLFTMFLIAIPVALMYGVGLGVLWLYTLGGRRAPRSTGQGAD
nr:twin-arginine translocase subunit TatC [Halomarina oriensis]